MNVLIKNMEMPKGCIYANDNDQTEYCPLLNHDDVPFCQYIESEPEIAIGIGERPVYCPLSDVPEPCENTVSRQAAIDAVMQYCPDDDGSCSKADRDIRELLDDIENLPSVQPQQIVRCKDCKHMITHEGYGYLGEPAYTCEGNMEGWVLPDSFCSHAERKDGD